MLLGAVDKDMRARLLLLFWRAWYLRNDIIHGPGKESVAGSARFLLSYYDSLHIAKQSNSLIKDAKGKGKVFPDGDTRPGSKGDNTGSAATKLKWEPPPQGWVKTNTDAAFCATTGETGIGVVVRDTRGSVLLTAWKIGRNCASVEEAEGEAMLEGTRLTAEWVRAPAILVSDCANLIEALKTEAYTRLSWASVVADIQAAATLMPGCSFERITRERNSVAHALANP